MMIHKLKPGLRSNSRSHALLLIDVINELKFEGAEEIVSDFLDAAHKIRRLKRRCHLKGIPVIYVNDNFGKWKSDAQAILSSALNSNSRGREAVSLIKPDHEDYFVLKPAHSGFYGTCLDILLSSLSAETLILCGIAGNICVHYTANDAYMRGYRLIIPRDCLVSNTPGENYQSLEHMRRYLKAKTPQAASLKLPFPDRRK